MNNQLPENSAFFNILVENLTTELSKYRNVLDVPLQINPIQFCLNGWSQFNKNKQQLIIFFQTSGCIACIYTYINNIEVVYDCERLTVSTCCKSHQTFQVEICAKAFLEKPSKYTVIQTSKTAKWSAYNLYARNNNIYWLNKYVHYFNLLTLLASFLTGRIVLVYKQYSRC